MSIFESGTWRAVGFAALTLATPIISSAAPLNFRISGDYSAAWIMDSSPRPGIFVDGVGFAIYDATGSFAGAATSMVDLYFYNASVGGGIQINDYNGNGDDLILTSSPQLYSGTEAAPTFAVGNFAMVAYTGIASTYALTISAVPEPGALALVLFGLGLVGLASRQRLAVDSDTSRSRPCEDR